MSRCGYWIDVDGSPVHISADKPPTERDIEAMRELARAVRARATIDSQLEMLECERGNHVFADAVSGPNVVGKVCEICGLEKDYSED